MQLDELIKESKKIAIFGHVRPDGDCVGSTLGLYNYICDNYPTINVNIYLERFPESYKILPRSDEIIEIFDENSKKKLRPDYFEDLRSCNTFGHSFVRTCRR